jgi:hypothetical protein
MSIRSVALYQAICRDVSQYTKVDSSTPWPGCTYKQFASSYLRHSIIRKWIPRDARQADAAALSSFVSANNRCREWVYNPSSELIHMIFGETRKIIDDFLHPFGKPLVQSYFDLLSSGRPGPGVNVGSNGTSYYTKYFSSPLTATSQYLYDEYRRYSAWIPMLSDAECQRYESFGPPSIVSGSRCSFVPKTSATSRMICIEPSLNMFYQLGLAHFIEERLKSYFGIDLSTQPSVNHRLGKLGSIDGSFATIDLSSASDSISLRLCESLFPKWFFELLLTLRSHTAEICGKKHPLYMLSTMGNGFTFPLQTLIFAAIVKAVYSVSSINSTFSVFGDDIICTTSSFSRVVAALNCFGFSVNSNKTFFEGGFRESCGADWFYGRPVRPVFVKKLDSPWDIMVAINQLNDWSAYTQIPLWESVQYLLSLVKRKFLTYVPYEENMDCGIRVPLILIDPKFDRNASYAYKAWGVRPQSIKILEGSIRAPRGLKGSVLYNPCGLWCSFLFGELVAYEIMVRHNLRSYNTKLRCTPRWDYIPPDSVTNGVTLSWQQWETAVVTNLT